MSITDKMRKAFDVCTVMAGVEPDFECVYMTKDAALLYLDEIDAENAKLRSELESVGTAAYLYGRSDLKAENEKLRELFADTLMQPRDYCKKYGIEYESWDSANAHLDARMRELGVEV